MNFTRGIYRGFGSLLQHLFNHRIDLFASFLTRRLIQPYEELCIPLRSQQRTLDQTTNRKAFLLRKRQYIEKHLLMYLRIADHTIAARNVFLACFKLRFDKRDYVPLTPIPSPAGKGAQG